MQVVSFGDQWEVINIKISCLKKLNIFYDGHKPLIRTKVEDIEKIDFSCNIYFVVLYGVYKSTNTTSLLEHLVA